MNSVNFVNNENNLVNLFITLCCSICPIIPFAIVDVYYSQLPEYLCLDYVDLQISKTLTSRVWLMVNGYMSLSNISLIILLFVAIYNNVCNWFIQIFQNIKFIKTFIFIKISFNISWTILGSILFSHISSSCPTNLRVYLWIRITFMFLFIIFSIKNIKQYVLDLENIGNVSEVVENRNNRQ